jgi:hypothetical protein
MAQDPESLRVIKNNGSPEFPRLRQIVANRREPAASGAKAVGHHQRPKPTPGVVH